MILSEEEAKAVQEVAKTSGKALDASQNVGAFAKQVFGDLAIDSVGLLSDKLKYYRLEKRILLEKSFKDRLSAKGITITRPISPKIGIPLIEQATIEDNEELRTKWANMLANAVNPEYKGTIKRSYVTILCDMEPLDVFILDILAKEYSKLDQKQKEQTLFDRSKSAQNFNIPIDQCEISLRNLMRLGCLKPGVITGGVSVGDHPLSSYKDTELVGITALGLEFYMAVN